MVRSLDAKSSRQKFRQQTYLFRARVYLRQSSGRSQVVSLSSFTSSSVRQNDMSARTREASKICTVVSTQVPILPTFGLLQRAKIMACLLSEWSKWKTIWFISFQYRRLYKCMRCHFKLNSRYKEIQMEHEQNGEKAKWKMCSTMQKKKTQKRCEITETFISQCIIILSKNAIFFIFSPILYSCSVNRKWYPSWNLEATMHTASSNTKEQQVDAHYFFLHHYFQFYWKIDSLLTLYEAEKPLSFTWLLGSCDF